MARRSQLQNALSALLLVCLLLTVALAWSLWRVNVVRNNQALEDPLTGLKNRRFLVPFMEHETGRLRRSARLRSHTDRRYRPFQERQRPLGTQCGR